jgi:hypothetical protein
MLSVTVLRGLGFSAVGALKGDQSALWLVYALPLTGIVGGAWFLFVNQPVALPKSSQELFDTSAAAVRRRFELVVGRYASLRRRLAGAQA